MINYQKVRIIGIIFVFLSTSILSGCAFKDIDKRLFISAIGIDPSEKTEGHFKVTLKAVIPTGSIKEAKGPTYAYLTEEGDSLAESIRILATHVDKALEFGHVKMIVLNEELLSGDLHKFMDFFIRRGDIQMIAWVTAVKSSAEDILKVEPDTENAASSAMTNFFDNTGTESPYVKTLELFEFRRYYIDTGIDAVIPLIETNEEKTELIINKAIVVKKEKTPMNLTSAQTKDFNSIYNQISGFSYKVKDDGFHFILDISKIKFKYQIITDGDTPRIDVKIKMAGVIGESNKQLDLADFKKYNKLASKELEQRFTKLFTTFQEKGMDPLGFGLRYRATRLHTKEIDSKWDEMYPTIDFNVTVKVHLKGAGAIQ